MPYFTVFTSTYNRGYTLFRLYESLKNQGTTDFEWLIVNDGSTDNTHQLVEEWIRKEKEFSIRYWKKKMEENQEQSIMGFGMREVNSFLWLILMIFYYRMRYQK